MTVPAADDAAPPLSLDALEERLSRPTGGVREVLARLTGDLLVLGAGGKMGPSLARMARRALDELGGAHRARRVIAVSRFADRAARAALEAAGVTTVVADLADPISLAALPDAPSVIYMAGQKFGTSDVPARTWGINTYLPGLVAERYYTLAERAIHAADPDALYFGDRLPIYYDPAAVKAMAPHVDAIAVNYNVDAGDGWLARYFFDGLEKLSGGKPVLVTEWFFAARENRTGNTNNGHLMTVGTQAERAQGAAAATRNFAALPEIVGTQWFQYYDHPKGGRSDGEDYNFGLVDIQDRPYERLVEALAAANRDAPTIHAAALEPSGRDAPVVLPHADIDIDAKSLTDWPKPASLLPPMKPSPGAVDFGEVYLSWSERGLALGTIGQDYFDIGLFPYSGGFPLGDAYRLELGVDFGAGPRRFTLFFIPPRTKLHDYPEMQARLCAGSAQQAIASGCTPVKNAETVYFGADQPRITAEMLLPWSALGISLPQPGAKLRAEVTMTSWHGERWMSLSGAAPDQAMTDAARWMPMRLGDGLAVKRSTGAPG